MSESFTDSENPPLSTLGRRTAPPPISWLMHQALKQPDLISLAAGFTDNATLPIQATQALVEELLADPTQAGPALQYGTGAGDDDLRQLTAARIQKLDHSAQHNSSVSPDELVITNGSQQFLYLLTETLCDPGDIVIVEDPTYFVYLSIMQSHGIEARGVTMTPHGLSLESLEQVLEALKQSGQISRLKFVYSVTYFQNPTGITTSHHVKREAVSLLRRYESAAGHPLYYVEDAAYRELRFPNQVPPASALTESEHRDRIIYTSTYSKPFATGIRIGYGILPAPLRDPLMRIKGNHDFGSPNFLQKILAGALASNRYEEHLETISQTYATKGAAMMASIQQHFPSAAEVTQPTGGLCLWATLPKDLATGPDSALFQAALDRSVLYVPGEFAFADDPTRPIPKSSMRLSFGSASVADITEGISRLGATIEAKLQAAVLA